ncbi:MAG: hypothetical protein FWC02_01405 [Firmicutes bacterium]|nr:hypothetical protein [Bacillota bacterium]
MISVKNEKWNGHYYVDKVKKIPTKNGNLFTTFTVKGKNRDGETPPHFFYKILTWQDLDVEDGDKVVIESIQSIKYKTREWNNNTYHDVELTCVCSKVESVENSVENTPPVVNYDNLPF